jgi:hypothetical protein
MLRLLRGEGREDEVVPFRPDPIELVHREALGARDLLPEFEPRRTLRTAA